MIRYCVRDFINFIPHTSHHQGCKRMEYNKDISRPDYIPSLNEFVADILCTIKQGDVTLAKPNTTGIIW